MQDLTIPGRACGACTLCCKVMEVTDLAKPRGVWCENCKPGVGCNIYAQRPRECATFLCGYLTNADLGEEWKPDKCRIILSRDMEGKRLVANVDPQRPDAWRKEPYYSKLKQWARTAARNRNLVVVTIGWRMIVVFPDRDVDLGMMSEDEHVITRQQATPNGVRWEAFKARKDDPRA